MTLTKKRKIFVNHIKSELTGYGVKFKDDRLTGIAPLDRFFTGLLFPIMSEDVLVADEEDYSSDPDSADKTEIQLVKQDKRYMPPSSAGFSFFITGENIKLRVYYKAAYWISSEENKTRSWKKESAEGKEIEFEISGKSQYLIFDNKAKIDALWRKYNNGYIVTITLSNQQKITEDGDAKEFVKQRNEKTLFEVEFKCIIESNAGIIAEYPATEKSLLSDEQREIELRYQDLKTYAVGHGVAVNWEKNRQDDVEIWFDFMPQVEVPQVTADTGGKNNKILEFIFLKQTGDSNVINELEGFVKNYEEWISGQNQKANNETDKETANSIINNLNIAKQRMQQGVHLLKTNHNAKIAFATMNEAMLMQWISGDNNKGISKDKSDYKWRPFQLGFILMVLESAINESSDYRDTLDLIWFPTGGGKTEAYLGLMAFLFVYRRLEYPTSSGGTIAIMRYTLRLLTTQQFVRATKVIFALDLIRQQKQQFGSEPFSIGLWVGQATSPNTFKQANQFIRDEKMDKFVLSCCPWCETQFESKNYRSTNDSFNFYCTNSKCEFGQKPKMPLPCNIVDEALYQYPPSLLIATVDKFARLAWEERACNFFGGANNKPPELIIQDELHLISDALGSIVGLYEVGIETALIVRGARVKYIASTATIKNAAKQVKMLFSKEMQLFPPSGLRYNDSYFAKTVPLDEKPGRLYIGYLVPLLDKQHCLAPLAANLLSAPIKLFRNEDEHLDNWWTQLIYHGSLKGLGNSSTLYQSSITLRLAKITVEHLKDDINEFSPNFLDENKDIKTLDDFEKIGDPEIQQIVKDYLPIRDLTIKELSSKKTAEENAQIFNALGEDKDATNSVDVALATNMVATGLDVSRLALMVINGQPLTTAEYIQASSRVGRGDVPGIVFINYYKTQARSLSHYENFRSYHDGFYRFVEPSSLTPFTYQARMRALHAALIIAVRHSNIGLSKNNEAGGFDCNNNKVRNLIKELKIRLGQAMSSQESKTKTFAHIDQLLNDWQNEVNYCKKNKIKMVYYEHDRGSQNLICNFQEKNGLWQTLQSMRNVENSALIKLVPGLKKRSVEDEE